MYFPNAIEEVSYHSDHIEKILSIIGKTFPAHFSRYLETRASTPRGYAAKRRRVLLGCGSLPDVDRKPYGGAGGVCPRNTVFHVGRKEKAVAHGHHPHVVFAVKVDARGSAQDQDPLVPGLVVPFSDGGGVSVGNDAFNAGVSSRDQRFKHFILGVRRKIVK